MKRIPTLDGWRGIAILLVLVDHGLAALHFTPITGRTTGQHGVSVFFVLSGFLITSRLTAEKQTTGAIDLRRFYVRRFFRLMPAAWLYLCFAFVMAMESADKIQGAINCSAALLFFRNYSYLIVPSDWLTGHFWTLSIEEQFYIVWPSMLAFAGARIARWAAVLAAAVIAIYRFAHWSTLMSLPAEHTQVTQLRADALLMGCAVALFMPSIRPYLRDWMALPLAAAFAVCVARYHLLVPLHESLIIALLLAVTSSSQSRIFSFLDYRPIAFLGTISYSLYLWQQPCTSIAYLGPVQFPIAVVALACLALASYYLVEKRFIALGHRETLAPS
jgi:peptidoglycan/LPS O-acetylase OafA/YrhL